MEKRFITSLTESEQQTVASADHEKRALRRWAHAILLSDQGHTINRISQILQVRRDAVSRWFKQWEASGLDGLVDKPRSGRTPVLDRHDHQRYKRWSPSILSKFESCRLAFRKRPASQWPP